MSFGTRLCGLALSVALSAVVSPAFAQPAPACPSSQNLPADGPFTGAVKDGLPLCAEPSLPPSTPAPVASDRHSDEPPPAGVPVVADMHVAATDLGFEKGIAPAPGRTVGYRGREYLVVEVAAIGNGPTFSGGSRFVITTQGGTLEVGLKSMDDHDRQVAAASFQ